MLLQRLGTTNQQEDGVMAAREGGIFLQNSRAKSGSLRRAFDCAVADFGLRVPRLQVLQSSTGVKYNACAPFLARGCGRFSE